MQWRRVSGTLSGGGCFVSDFIAHQVIPDFLKFILVIAALVGAVYGGALALATFPPEQSDVVRPLPHEKLRQD
jgi:hypothetical protein